MQYDTRSSGYKLSFEGPNSIDEYDEKAGRQGAALEDAVNNTIYRSTLPEWQSEFGKVLQEKTGIPREIDKDATAKVKSKAKDPANTRDVPERFRTYNTRVKKMYAGVTDEEDSGDKTKLAELQAWAQETAAKIAVDPSPARISAVSRGDLIKAEDVLDHDTDYIEAKIQKYLAGVPDFELVRDDDNKPEKQSLARLIGRYIDTLL